MSRERKYRLLYLTSLALIQQEAHRYGKTVRMIAAIAFVAGLVTGVALVLALQHFGLP